MKSVLLLVFLALAAPATAQIDRTELSAALRVLYLDPGLRQNLRDRGFTGERFDIMVDHTRSLFSDEAIVGAVANLVERSVARGVGNDPMAIDRLIDVGLLQGLSDGIRRLSPGELWTRFQLDSAFLSSLRRSDCGDYVRGDMRQNRAARLTDAFMSRVNPDYMREYYRIERKAVRAGLTRTGRARDLSPDQVARAEEAFFPAIDHTIQAQPNSRKLFDEWQKGTPLEGRHACTFAKIFGSAVKTLPASDRDLVVAYLMFR